MRINWRKVARGLRNQLAVFAVLGAIGFLVAASGIIPISASSGHLPTTKWFLEFAMSRSVATHSAGIEVPPLDEPHLSIKGAAHFEIGCAPCHGSPKIASPRIARELTPVPPDLTFAAKQWETEELFYIVKHGVKMTGMPAWPARQRDDEVWAVTAFLLKLPDLDAAQYRDLVTGNVQHQEDAAPLEQMLPSSSTPAIAVMKCARCHGLQGQGRVDGAFPALTGQSVEYLRASLRAYAEGTRPSGYMEPIAAALSPKETEELLRYYTALPARTTRTLTVAAASLAQGKEIAADGLPSKGVPACGSCHGPSPTAKNPHYPRLAGMSAYYLFEQLKLFRSQRRGGTDYSHLMHRVSASLSDDEMRAATRYYESLPREEEPLDGNP